MSKSIILLFSISFILLVLSIELLLPSSIQNISLNYQLIKSIIKKVSSNPSISIMKILKKTSQNTKLTSQSGIIEITRNLNYCLYDMCVNKSERDVLIRVFSNQTIPLYLTIGNVEFKVVSIDIPYDISYDNEDKDDSTFTMLLNKEKEGKVVLSNGSFNCLIFRSGNFLLYICGVELDLNKVYNEQKDVLMMLKEFDRSHSNFIIF